MQLPIELDDICRRAVKVWGQDAQEDIVIGEIGELLSLWGRRRQKRSTTEEWVDEIVDCMFMVHQLAHIHGIDRVAERIAEKLPKLLSRVKQAEEARAGALNTEAMSDAAAERELYVDAIRSCRAMTDDMMLNAERHKLIARYGFEKEKWNWHIAELRALSTPTLKSLYADLKSVT